MKIRPLPSPACLRPSGALRAVMPGTVSRLTSSGIWPRFGENLRVLEWIVSRCAGEGDVKETPVGYIPEPGAIDPNGLDEQPDMDTLLALDGDGWRKELAEIAKFLQDFEPRVPEELHRQLARTSAALG